MANEPLVAMTTRQYGSGSPRATSTATVTWSSCVTANPADRPSSLTPHPPIYLSERRNSAFSLLSASGLQALSDKIRKITLCVLYQ
jgi:hypothetical protein